MEDDTSSNLAVGFLIEADYSVLQKLQEMMGSTEMKVLQEAKAIEAATKGMISPAATLQISAFGSAATKELKIAARETAAVEKAGELLIRKLEQQNAAFGKSKAELRHMRSEEIALAAERVGNTDLAIRLRKEETDLWGREYEVIRKNTIARENAAEDAAEAEVLAQRAVIAELRERAQLENALYQNTGLGRSKATDAGAGFSALSAKAAEDEAAAVREAAEAYRMFEAVAKQKSGEYRQREADTAAAAMRAEAEATARLAREHDQLAAMVRGSQSAQEADAAAAERLRLSTDPLYAAMQRLNSEIAESTRLYYAGAIAQDEYDRQQGVLTGRLREVEQHQNLVNGAFGSVGATGKLAGHHMQNLAFQFQDIGVQMFAAAGSSEPLKMAMMALMQQGSQIYGIMGQAGVGIRGVGAAFASMTGGIIAAAATNPIILGIAATVGVFSLAVKSMTAAANDGGAVEAYAKSLGLSAEEIKKLDNVTVTFGDTSKAVFQIIGSAIWDNIGPAVTSVWDQMKEWMAWIGSGVKAGVNFMIGGFVGAYQIITKNWQTFPSVLGDLFLSGVNNAISAINLLIRKAVEGVNFFAAQANQILPDAMQIPALSVRQIDTVANQYAGAAKKIGDAAQQEMSKAMGVDYLGGFSDAVASQALENAKSRIRQQAEDKGFLGSDDDKARAKERAMSDAQKAYEALIKAAQEYAASQLEEAAKVGLTAKQLRLYADAAAIAKAPTDALKEAIRDAAAVREEAYGAQSAKDFQNNVIQPLRDELALYGLVGPARDAASLGLEKQAFLTEHMDDGLDVATTRWQEYYDAKMALIGKDAAAEREAEKIQLLRDEFSLLIDTTRAAGDAMANAFGRFGGAVGDVVDVLTIYQERQADIAEQRRLAGNDQARLAFIEKQNITNQLQGFTALAGAAKGLFKEHSAGYKAMAAAEKAFALVQMANTAINVASGAAKMFASLGPWAFPAVAAMVGVMAALGFGGGSGANITAPETNMGTGTVFGDSSAKSDSIKNAIDQLREVDTLMLGHSREMAASLRSIESQIGGFASLLVRNADSINASGGVAEGFKMSTVGSILSKVPLIGGILGGLFGTKTSIVGNGLFGDAQSLGQILGSGFDASYYSDVQKKKKLFGLTTSTKYSTNFSAADPNLENQFTMILRSFNDAIIASAGPLEASTDDIQRRLNGFVLNIGRIDLKGLTGSQIEEKLNAVFGAAADNMASAAFPIINQFQQVGEGAFETLVRVASTLESVSGSMAMLGHNAQTMGMAAKLALVDQFDGVSDFSNSVESYFSSFYTKQEQAAAKSAQLTQVFTSLGLTLPSSLANYRALVDAQNLASDAGRDTYATLLKLAPAFAELQAAMEGAKSAADIASERTDLERQLLELRGDAQALRALQLARLDASNRALQLEIWGIQDAQAAAKAADELRKAWSSVGDSLMDEVRRIRGLDEATGGGFAALMSQYNVATNAARGGDIDAAKTLPQLSQAVLAAAADAATSRQELDRVRAQMAASLESTHGVIASLTGRSHPAGSTAAAMLPAASPAAANEQQAASIDELRAETARLRADLTAALAVIANNTGSMKRTLENVTSQSGGDAVSVSVAA